MTTHRKANVVSIKRQPDQRYLVANGCPHSRPDEAPFYACMCAVRVVDRGREGWVRLASCEHLVSTNDRDEDGVDAGEADFLIECGLGGVVNDQNQIGLFGIPAVSHADGDSDGGDTD